MKLRRKDALLFMVPETKDEGELLMELHLKILKAHGWIDRESGKYLFMVYKPDYDSSTSSVPKEVE